jgi:integrase
MVKNGDDPSEQKKIEAIDDQYIFRNIAEAFFQKTEKGISESTASNYKRYLKYMVEEFGDRNINDITIKDITPMLLRFDNAGKQETATRILRLLKTVYKYAVSRGLISHNTANDIDARDLLSKKVEKHFDFIDNEEDFSALLNAIDDYNGDPLTKYALQFASMAFLRPSNVRSLRWDQIDTDKNLIEYSEEEMKSDRKHIVPVTPQMRVVFERAAQLTRGRSVYVFPSPLSNVRVMSENTLNMAIKRLGFNGQMTSHGFRHSASTLLHEHIHIHKVSSEVIEMQMAHKDDNRIRGTYNHAQYLPERKRLMQWWCDYLDEIKRDIGTNHEG